MINNRIHIAPPVGKDGVALVRKECGDTFVTAKNRPKCLLWIKKHLINDRIRKKDIGLIVARIFTPSLLQMCHKCLISYLCGNPLKQVT